MPATLQPLVILDAPIAHLRRTITRRADIGAFISFAELFFYLPHGSLSGPRGTPDVSDPRLVAMNSAHSLFPRLPGRQLAAAFRRRGHASIAHARRRVAADPNLALSAEALQHAWHAQSRRQQKQTTTTP